MYKSLDRLKQPLPAIRFDLVIILCGLFFVSGLYTDQKITQKQDETVYSLNTISTELPTPDVFTVDSIEIAINNYRLENSKKALKNDFNLEKLATESLVISCVNGFITGHDGLRALKEKGKLSEYKEVGENLYSGQKSTKNALKNLIASPIHNDILLRDEWLFFGVALKESCISILFANK